MNETKKKEDKTTKEVVKVDSAMDKRLKGLEDANVGQNLNKIPLDIEEDEKIRVILYNKGSYKNGNREIRTVALLGADKVLRHSANKDICNALFDMELYVGVEIHSLGIEELDGGFERARYKVDLLNS